MSAAEPAGEAWRKSSYSGAPDKNCVEVAATVTGSVAVRDSKDAAGPALVFTLAEWLAFERGVRAGEFSLERAVLAPTRPGDGTPGLSSRRRRADPGPGRRGCRWRR
jgi:hypothetical protein